MTTVIKHKTHTCSLFLPVISPGVIAGDYQGREDGMK